MNLVDEAIVFRDVEGVNMQNGSPFMPELFSFLEELKENNNKIWFEANRFRYTRFVKEPMLQFIHAMGERLARISPSFVADPRTNGGSMFRIYRDVRFSKNKAPYKENAGCQFRHSVGKGAHAPGFYLHLQPGNSFAGGGIWQPPTPDINKIRDAIVAAPEEWSRVKEFIHESDSISMMEADSLKRPPRGYAANLAHMVDLKRKSLYAGCPLEDKQVVAPDFLDQMESIFLDALPLMRFVCLSLDLSFS